MGLLICSPLSRTEVTPAFQMRESERKERESLVQGYLNCRLFWRSPPKSFNVPKEIFPLPCNNISPKLPQKPKTEKPNPFPWAVWFLNVNALRLHLWKRKRVSDRFPGEKGQNGNLIALQTLTSAKCQFESSWTK